MTKPRIAQVVLCLLAGVALLWAAPVSTAAPQQQASATVTIYYDDSQAAEYTGLVDEAAAVWNNSLENVEFVEGSGGVSVFTQDDGPAPGWASCFGCTSGTIGLSRNKIDESGAGELRVIVHEFGHILSLQHPPDIGNCDKVMAGGRCDNPQPNTEEVAAVEQYWQNGAAADARRSGEAPDETGVFDAPARSASAPTGYR